jgi:formate hydrogenlyase subunit 3/multisubunit Na+/H+ antiporter MnhD subunit
LTNILILSGLILNLIASILIGYGRIFRSKKTIEKESQTRGEENIYEEKHRLLETRVAQLGAILLAIGFAVQIWGNLTDS